ncbi:uncharacterized protein LOC144158224 isoform X2 [Haemaphysalis longicornis]
MDFSSMRAQKEFNPNCAPHDYTVPTGPYFTHCAAFEPSKNLKKNVHGIRRDQFPVTRTKLPGFSSFADLELSVGAALQYQPAVDRTKVGQRRESTSGFRGGLVQDDRLTSFGSSSATVGPEEPEVVTIKEEPEDPDDSQSSDAGYRTESSRRPCAFAMDEGLQSMMVEQMAELEGGGDQGGTFDRSLSLPVEPVACSRRCGSREAHRQHVQSSRYPGSERRLFPCDICHRPFGRNQNLLRHYRLVHGETRPFQCRRCGRSFDAQGELYTHMKIVHWLRP